MANYTGYLQDKNKNKIIANDGSMGQVIVEDVQCKNLYNTNLRQGAMSYDGGYYFDTELYITFADYINVEGGKKYTIHAESNKDFIYSGVVFYNNGVWVGYNQAQTFTVPSNANQIKFNFLNETDGLKPSDLYNVQLEEGDKVTSYTDYKKFGYNKNESMGKIVVDDIKCKNLFNKNNCVDNYYLGYDNNGEPVWDSNMSYMADYIEVEPNKQYTLSNNAPTIFIVHEYDENKQYITYSVQNDAINSSYTVTTNPNTKYVRISVGRTMKDYEQFEKGNKVTNYVSYKEYGAPTIIESGSNYMKFSDGHLFQWGIGYKGNEINYGDVILPVPFINTTYTVTITPQYYHSMTYSFSISDKSNSQFRTWLSDTKETFFDWEVKGFWK